MQAYGNPTLAYKGSYMNPAAYRYTYRSIPLEKTYQTIENQQYEMLEKLGQGGFGAVYSARRVRDGKSVAIKVTSLAKSDRASAAAYSQGMLTEIAMSRRLRETSNHIVQLFAFDFDESKGLGYIVMELGLYDLEKYFQRTGRPQPPERKMIWRQLVDISSTLHNRNIVHLDIKPVNLLVFPNKLIKLIDLGIAKKSFTTRGGRNGTIPYSAPEVVGFGTNAFGINTTKCDVWSWGAILYRMAYSRPPDYSRRPCYSPPTGVNPSRDPHLIDVLQHTLVDYANRVSPPWLASHHFTIQ